MSKENFCTMFERSFTNIGQLQNDAFCVQLFNALDLDKNGHIDFREFVLGLNLSTKPLDEKIRWAFRLYDISQDSLIQRTEIKQIVESILCLLDHKNYKTRADQFAGKLFSGMDIDEDGTITEDEFMIYCRDQGGFALETGRVRNWKRRKYNHMARKVL